MSLDESLLDFTLPKGEFEDVELVLSGNQAIITSKYIDNIYIWSLNVKTKTITPQKCR